MKICRPQPRSCLAIGSTEECNDMRLIESNKRSSPLTMIYSNYSSARKEVSFPQRVCEINEIRLLHFPTQILLPHEQRTKDSPVRTYSALMRHANEDLSPRSASSSLDQSYATRDNRLDSLRGGVRRTRSTIMIHTISIPLLQQPRVLRSPTGTSHFTAITRITPHYTP